MKKNYICCLCKKKFFGWGNNPEPLEDGKKKCCDKCNMIKVILARLRNLTGQRINKS